MAEVRPRLLTVSEASQILALKPATIRAWVAKRKLSCVHCGRAVRFFEEEILEFIKLNTVPAIKNNAIHSPSSVPTKENFEQPIEELEISIRTYKCLKNAHIETIQQLVDYDEIDLLKLRNFGRKSLLDLKAALWKKGFSLRGLKTGT